jgi:photosystem II stability/assembly factor-like uncharacterized protein
VGHAAAGLPATVAALDDPVSIDSVGADLWLVYQGSHAQSGCHAGVLVSRDGGRTWRVSLRLPSATDLIDTSSFVGDRYGWVTVVNDRDPRPWRTAMLRTADDGRTWQRVVPRAAAPVLPADWMEFVDARHGYLFNVVEDTQWRTSDGGASWRPSAPPDAGVDPSLCAVDAHESWLAIGDWPTESAPDLHGGALYSSTDAGITWQPSGRFSDVPLSDVWFVDRLHGWVAGEDPHGHAILYGTRDGGRHWRPQLDLGRRGRVYEFLDVGGRPNVWLYPDDTWNRAGDDYLYRLL